MAVTVDHEPLQTSALGLYTIGQVLSHLQKDKKLVVQMLIDGQEPELSELGSIRQQSLENRTIFIETADPRGLALEVLGEAAAQLPDAHRCKEEAGELFQKNQPAKALQQLGACIRIWQHAEDSVMKTAELLRLDLSIIEADGTPLQEMLEEFSTQLREIKSSLEQRDFVALSDVLVYEMADVSTRWSAAIDAICALIRSLR